jgi:protease-4
LSLDADAIVERRRLKRKLAVWRIFAVIAIAAVIAVVLMSDREDGVSAFASGDHVARITISGFISDDVKLQRLLERVSENAAIKAVILRVDSLGGSTTGGEALYTEVRRLAETKPVVTVFGTTATSAAYMVALGSDHIISRANSITGSVGVIFQWARVTTLLENLGIDVNQIKSGEFKAVPSPFEPEDERARAIIEQVLADSFIWFVDIVKERRNLSEAALADIRSGRVYTGQQALANGLVDAIGDERQARAWLEETHGISSDLRVRDWEPRRNDRFSWLQTALSGLARLTGIAELEWLARIGAGLTSAGKSLDGLISVWQPEK